MANSITSQTITNAIYPTAMDDRSYHTIAQRMIEVYCDRSFSLRRIESIFSVDTDDGQLLVMAEYPINFVHTVEDQHGQDLPYLFNDQAVFPKTLWASNTVVVRYTGGMPMQIYNAIERQAKVLETRPNTAPEIADASVPYDIKFNTSMRSGLAPDVKQMVFSFRKIGF